jgi:polyhydroxyalkanoate synthesis regulator phasin
MDFSGNLEVLEPTTIFQIFNLSPLTGSLKFISETNMARLYFRDGKLIFASIESKKMKLGEYMVKKGLITDDQLRGSLHAYRHEQGHVRVGQVMVERGYITEEDLTFSIQELMQEIVIEVISWERGHFIFQQGMEPRGEDVLLATKIDHLLLEATRRMDDARR